MVTVIAESVTEMVMKLVIGMGIEELVGMGIRADTSLHYVPSFVPLFSRSHSLVFPFTHPATDTAQTSGGVTTTAARPILAEDVVRMDTSMITSPTVDITPSTGTTPTTGMGMAAGTTRTETNITIMPEKVTYYQQMVTFCLPRYLPTVP